MLYDIFCMLLEAVSFETRRSALSLLRFPVPKAALAPMELGRHWKVSQVAPGGSCTVSCGVWSRVCTSKHFSEGEAVRSQKPFRSLVHFRFKLYHI